ncbi:dihydroorotase [Anaerobacillus isosaccharinicus]|uniref:Amidohydrolase n=1 Tax=Anaerobacillus isosaccharinicus TaxID=1532552 RepID=A0A1S2LPS9_9BACI|nr:dihydroorotase family protein [Anaerobacillus isosaccharinicus]MBA5586439.1 dihydroorotase family protein [Anaerobacillus isosaccharinicus]QOY35318.1 dihydroorotase family protein [Anaerobacillus isosaccharinicus]
MFDLQVINATIVTSENTYRGSISIQGGVIAAISEIPLGNAKQTIDANGLQLVPGMVDQHVHFMDPAETEREDFIHGSSAAAIGGVTTVIEHTHAAPVRSVKAYNDKINHVCGRSVVDFGLTAHVFPEDLGNLKALWDSGVVLFKIFTCTTHGIPTLNNDELFRAFKEIASFDGRCLVHCEDDAITEGNEQRLKHNQRCDHGIISEWRSETAEDIAVANVALMARLTGVTATIAHISHSFVIDLIKREQAEGAKLYAEVCPQYLFLNDKDVIEKGPFAKFTPPARGTDQSNKLLDLINDGSIQLLSTDHAPSTSEQKTTGTIWDCNFGLPGVETTLPMMLNLVNEGKITLQRVVQLFSEMPAKVLGLYPKKGCIVVGADADLVLLDLSRKWTIKNEDIISKAGWSPYHGTECTGKPVVTIVRGNIVVENGSVTGNPGVGAPVKRVLKTR